MSELEPPLPKEVGFYLWYVLDYNYTKVGLVQILQDNEEHLNRLADRPNPKSFHVYEVSGRKLTMYHCAQDNLPEIDATGKPVVCGWIPFDYRLISHYSHI